MDIESFFTYFESPQFWLSVIILILATILFGLHKKIVEKFKTFRVLESFLQNRSNELHFFYIVLGTIYWFLVAALVLRINGINLASWIAGLGVVGIIVGFALQDLLKDFMMGINIVTDNFFSIGDVIRYEAVDGRSVTGKVVNFNMKVTRLYDLKTGSTMTICNRNISEIEVLSDWLDISIPASYDETKSRMDGVMRRLCSRINELEDIKGSDYLGTSKFGDSSIYYLVRAYCPQEMQCQRKRDILGLVQTLYEEEGLSIPYPQLDAHLFTAVDKKSS